MNIDEQSPYIDPDLSKIFEKDFLGRQRFARQVFNRLSAPDCPSAIGLYGGWGVGKTFLLKLLMMLNEREKTDLQKQKLHFVYIDAWSYEISGDLALPIIVEIRKLINKKNLPASDYSKPWLRVVGVLGRAVLDVSLRNLVDLEWGDVEGYASEVKAKELEKSPIKNLGTLVNEIAETRAAFVQLVKLVRQSLENRRLVLLVDNLDRCAPENVVRLLESVKNYLSAPDECTWVFAMDAGVVASYIDKKYEDTRMDGNSYLDKIIPEQYHIPPISERDMNAQRQFLAAAQSSRSGLPQIDLRQIPQMPEVLVPRRLLKTARKFYEAYTADTPLGTSASPDTVFALILLYNTWPVFYERFSSDSASHIGGILTNFITEEETKVWKYPKVPLSSKFTGEMSLGYYLYRCFIKNKEPTDSCRALAASMVWLREVGLP